jgi:hypothetical protein
MRSRLYALSALLGLVCALSGGAIAAPGAGQTKRQAEVNVLRALPHMRPARRLPDLVNPRTHLLRDNTEAICHHRGRRGPGNRYRRFVCIVRPHVHIRQQGLYARYRVLSRTRFMIHWLAYHPR